MPVCKIRHPNCLCKQYSRQTCDFSKIETRLSLYTESRSKAKIPPMKPKTMLYSLVAVGAAVFAFSTPDKLAAQSDLDSPEASALLHEVLTQQTTLSDNQKKIDEKIANVAESVRVARIFVSRGGK